MTQLKVKKLRIAFVEMIFLTNLSLEAILLFSITNEQEVTPHAKEASALNLKLIRAIKYANAESVHIISSLIEAGADINAITKNQLYPAYPVEPTVLMKAVYFENINVVRLLLAARVNSVSSESRDFVAINLAMRCRYYPKREDDFKIVIKIITLLQNEPTRRVIARKKWSNPIAQKIIDSTSRSNIIFPLIQIIVDYSIEKYEDISLEDRISEYKNILIPDLDIELFQRLKQTNYVSGPPFSGV